MTSVADGGTATASRGRLLWAALILSLLVNAFFLGSAAWWVSSWHRMTPAERFQQVVRELRLNNDQRDAFQVFVITARRGTRQLFESNRPLLGKVWDELGKPKPDQDEIAKLVDQATNNRRTYQKSMTAALAQFLSDLSPEQRERFISLTQQKHNPISWRLRRLVTP
jgi:Spy/CpxP family protein refolding chaperone